jgi:hypothetical protein
MKLKTSAQKIQEIFTKNKLEFQVIELSHSTRTAQDAANALSCEIAQIVKSLIFYENISKQEGKAHFAARKTFKWIYPYIFAVWPKYLHLRCCSDVY